MAVNNPEGELDPLFDSQSMHITESYSKFAQSTRGKALNLSGGCLLESSLHTVFSDS